MQLNWWEQNLHHLPQAPVPHAEVSGSAELPAAGKNGPQHLVRQVPRRHAYNDSVNNLSRIPHTIFRVSCTEEPYQSPEILGTAQPSPLAQEGCASTVLSSRQWERSWN